MIRAKCPQCDRVLNVGDHLAGKLVLCPDCKGRIRIPKPEADDDDDARPQAVPRRKADPDRSESRVAPSRRPRPRDDDDEEDLPLPRARRRREDDDDEDDDRPRKRRSRHEDEDDDRPRKRRSRHDEDDDRPRRKAPRKRASTNSEGAFGMDLPSLIVMGVSVAALLLVVLSLLIPPVALLVLFLGAAMSVTGGIWFLIVAFQEDALSGILCLLLPFYALYFLVTHLEITKKPFFLQLIGTLCCWVSIARLEAGG